MTFEPVIGLEIHVQLKTKSKLFCGCDNRGEDAAPNTTICPICMGHPGVLPALNEAAIKSAVRAALALNAHVPDVGKFDRKNYFYPDLPKGYQISMLDEPICLDGKLIFDTKSTGDDRRIAEVGIERIHMEEDAAKSSHVGDKTLIDYNRAGTPLIEIVTKPDLASPHEAKVFLQNLRRIMRYLDVSDADMEKGHLRCDANISLRPVVTDAEKDPGYVPKLYPKTEVKNMNSFKSVERALHYEIERQTRLWEKGEPPMVSSTRGWDDAQGVTVLQRLKEGGADYRFFPEPDLPPINLAVLRERLRSTIPELPIAKQKRFVEEYGMAPADAAILVEEKYLADYVEHALQELEAWVRSTDSIEGDAEEKFQNNKAKLVKLTNGWLISKLFGLMEKHSIDIRRIKITPENFAEFITLIFTSQLSGTNGLVVLEEMLLTGADPSHIIEEKKLEQTSNEEEIADLAREAIEASPDIVAKLKAGNDKVIMVLVGAVIKSSGGKANPQMVQKILKKLIK